MNKDEIRYKDPEKRHEYQRKYKREYMRNYRKLHPNYRGTDSKQRLKRRQERKKFAVEFKGGKCQQCGYKKNFAALEFHHPNKKDIHWSVERNFLNWAYEKFLEELKKVELVCSNCHQEIEHPELTIDQKRL